MTVTTWVRVKVEDAVAVMLPGPAGEPALPDGDP